MIPDCMWEKMYQASCSFPSGIISSFSLSKVALIRWISKVKVLLFKCFQYQTFTWNFNLPMPAFPPPSSSGFYNIIFLHLFSFVSTYLGTSSACPQSTGIFLHVITTFFSIPCSIYTVPSTHTTTSTSPPPHFSRLSDSSYKHSFKQPHQNDLQALQCPHEILISFSS